jgi:hypothetical protein
MYSIDAVDMVKSKTKMASEEHLVFCLTSVTTDTKMESDKQHLILCLATVKTN